jgi:DNA-binding CsgD family transcriptional regulator/PAS domain-containing protein
MELSSDFLGDLYATAENPQAWTPLLDGLRTRLGAASAVVQVLEESPERLDAVWQARDTYSAANSALHDRCLNNPDNPRLDKRSTGHLSPSAAAELMPVGSDGRLFGPYSGRLTEIQRRLAQVGLGHAFWVSCPISERFYFSLVLHRQAGNDLDLTDTEEALLRALLPHLQRSAKLRFSLERASSRTIDLENALDRLNLALVLCDAGARIHWLNTAARDLIARTRSLRIVAGRLEAPTPADNAALRGLVRSVASGAADSLVGVMAPEGGDPVHARATSSVGRPFPSERGQVALFLSRSSLGSPLEPSDLSTIYRLTPAEARLAAALAGGASLSGYSKQRGIAVGTARNQLKQVLSKTDTRNQSDLIRTICNSVASCCRRLS